jgi:Na+/H+ antiporter NhaD/arsenite permease-like protein
MHGTGLGLGLGMELSVLWILPFAGLLLAIAVCPLAVPHFWESNRNKAVVAAVFGLPVAVFIAWQDPSEIVSVVEEYFSFISLLAALFIISGGIHIRGDLQATPKTNAIFLLVGSVLANFIGTTGASVLLIRAVLRTNRERSNTRHIPVFFIFLVSNIGGLLLPIGDPPLFLGYLQGVPFFWTLGLLPFWLVTVTAVIAIFLVVDTLAYRRETPESIFHDRAMAQPLGIDGSINFLWLGGVLAAAVLLGSPFRELVMWSMAGGSWVTTKRITRKMNEFTFAPIVEVAVLFAGIFGAMIPCLLILKARGAETGITEAWQFFWASGLLSSFLDNAPTYLTFVSLGQGVTAALGLPVGVVLESGGIAAKYLTAVSVGAVFMGANTYIGNAPNFMVKCISEEWKVRMPSFFGYMVWSGCILLPVFVLNTLIFFR